MMDSYKKAMDRIKTDKAYKEKFMQSLNEKDISAPKKTVRFLPVFSYMATAAALLLVVYCSSLFFMKKPETVTPPEVEKETQLSVGTQPTGDTQTAQQNTEYISNVAYFTFDGFEEYDIKVESKAILIGNVEKGYTLSNLIREYYPTLTGDEGNVVINDGMVDNFLDVEADGKKEINVYVNDREVMNLDEYFVSTCMLETNDVFFKVSVV